MPHFTRFAGLLAAATLFAAGCAEEPAQVDIYRVRGVVTALPQAGDPISKLMVHHEAIPTFIGQSGANEPMAEMVMPFPTASGVAVDGLKVGDKVQLRMEVTRGEGFSYQATEITPLADDLELDLGGSSSEEDHAGHDHSGHGHTGHDHATH